MCFSDHVLTVAERTKSSPLPNGIDSLARKSDSTSSIEEDKSQTAKKSVEKLAEEKDDKTAISSQSGEIKNEKKSAAAVDAEEDVVDAEEVFVEDVIGSVEKNNQRKEETEEGDMSESKDEKLDNSSGREGASTREDTDTNEDGITNDATSKPDDIHIVVTDEERVVGETAKAAELVNDSPSSPSSSTSSPPSSPLPPPLPTSSPPPLD